MKAIVLAAILLIAVACGQVQGRPTSGVVSPTATPAATPSSVPGSEPSSSPSASPGSKPSPVATPKTSPTLLFAVLEARGTANAWTYNTVAIAGLDGYARAKTTFTPMPMPSLGCIGAVLPQSAHVAAGKVFFADGKGVVRSLAINGIVATVATFPLVSSQQMLSFAVSPDGTTVLGTVFTTPNNAYPCTGSPSSGTYAFDAYSATSGGSSRLLYHESWTKPQDVLALTGWDAVGPIGTYPTVWATQGGGPGSTLGVFVRVDAATLKPGTPLTDPRACQVWHSVQSGAFVCTKDGVITNGGTEQQNVAVPVSVRLPDGTESWQFTLSGTNGPSLPFLSPDGVHVIMCCSDDSNEWVIGRDGSRIKLGATFYGSGWIDSTTVIGEFHPDPLQQPPLPLSYVALSAPGTVVSMGFAGQLVGTIRN
jgi:hypothetical protein